MGPLHTGREKPTASRIGPSHLLAAAAILGLLVMPVAFAGVGKPGATKSANLTKQIKKLKRRLAALETKAGVAGPQGPQGAQGPQGPAGALSGAAGGDLAGSYPNPVIASGAVNSAKVADGTLTGDDIDEASLQGLVKDTVVRTTSIPVTPGVNVGGTADCGLNEVATGGGIDADASTVNDRIVNSYPSPETDGATPTGWTANLTWGGTTGTTNVVVYVICARR